MGPASPGNLTSRLNDGLIQQVETGSKWFHMLTASHNAPNVITPVLGVKRLAVTLVRFVVRV